jgi:hypothetical protein
VLVLVNLEEGAIRIGGVSVAEYPSYECLSVPASNPNSCLGCSGTQEVLSVAGLALEPAVHNLPGAEFGVALGKILSPTE